MTYEELLKKILDEGVVREGRNGKTRALFAQQLRFDIRKSFPVITTKEIPFNLVKAELLWFLQMKGKNRASDLDLRKLTGKEKTIWTANAESDYWMPNSEFDGDLGRIYGIQWRNWKTLKHNRTEGYDYMLTIDQIEELIVKLKVNPFDRRLIVSAWNPGELDDMALPPCHMMFQCFVNDKKELSLHMIQRSCDMFLGVPFNIASYALLCCMLAQVTGLKPGELILTLNDAHIYEEHTDAVREQLSRESYPFPELNLNLDIKNIDDFKMEDIKLSDYQSHETIKAKMIV